MPTAVIESVSQLVAEYRADRAVIQRPAIEIELTRNLDPVRNDRDLRSDVFS